MIRKMVQDILVYITITAAISYMFWGLYKSFTPNKDGQNTVCGGCSTSGCDTKSFKKKFFSVE